MYKTCTVCGGIHLFESNRCRKNTDKLGFGSNPRTDVGHRLRHNFKMTKLAELFREDSKNLCALCLLDGVVSNSRVEMHHIEPIKERPDLAYDCDNLICLCTWHHVLAEKGIYSRDYLREIKPPLGFDSKK